MSKVNGKSYLTFKVVFPTYITNNVPTTGTITLAGVTITLVAADLISPTHVAKKIAAASIANYTVSYYNNVVMLERNLVGIFARPALPTLGTSTNIFFADTYYYQGLAKYPIVPKYGYPTFGSASERFDFSASGASDPIILLTNGAKLSLALAPAGSTARIEYTQASLAEIKASPSACTWTVLGSAVAVYTESSLTNPATAIRVNITIGSSCALFIVR